MKSFKVLFSLTAILVALSCSTTSSDACFSFRPDGTFRILQIADTHFSNGKTKEERAGVIDRLGRDIDTENPDLIIFTGDNVTSCDTKEIWGEVLEMLDSKGVPFACTYGNHDREEMYPDYELPQCFVNDPLNINKITAEGWLEDLAIEIKSAATGKRAAVIYVMDSGDYASIPGYGDYGWFTHDQIHWYVNKSRGFAKENGNVPVPSYAYFHIPVNEFYRAYSTGLICGNRGEKECPGDINSGILAAFEENSDVHGIFVGHDHSNDYVARIGNVAAVYGRCSHDKAAGEVPGNGSRIVELREGDYGFRTWVREADGVVDDIHFDVDLDMKLRQACEPEGLKPGLVRTMYSEVDNVEDMEQTAVRGESSITPTPRMIDKMGEGDYGAVQEGYIYVPETGAVSFNLGVNDEGFAVIDDAPFRPTPLAKGMVKLNLEKGYHHIKIYMKCKNGGGCWVKFTWHDQFHCRFHEIPADFFFHAE